jgi:hypothetical protein
MYWYVVVKPHSGEDRIRFYKPQEIYLFKDLGDYTRKYEQFFRRKV